MKSHKWLGFLFIYGSDFISLDLCRLGPPFLGSFASDLSRATLLQSFSRCCALLGSGVGSLRKVIMFGMQLSHHSSSHSNGPSCLCNDCYFDRWEHGSLDNLSSTQELGIHRR